MTKFMTKKVLLSLLSLPILIAAQICSLVIGNLPVMLGLPDAVGNAVAAAAYIGLALWGLRLLCRKGLGLTPAECGMTRVKIKPVWAVTAVLMPAIVCGTALLMPGTWERSQMDAGRAAAMLTGGILYYGVAAAVVEEAVFRGIIMKAVERRWNKRAAVLVPSVLFGLVHIIGNDLDFISIFQLLVAGSLVGILFSLVAYESGSIWSGALIHAVWNIAVLGGLLHIGVQADPASLFSYVQDTDSFLLTGGDFGIEASIVSVVVYAAFALLAWRLVNSSAGPLRPGAEE